MGFDEDDGIQWFIANLVRFEVHQTASPPALASTGFTTSFLSLSLQCQTFRL
ncbi:hypothetical protein PanWU01x14_361360 [Parasponia andersonii]|uniref:Uncharacterized protein n=1 Tax=Parasponia andersonii TaxID=3476 RepID=A0A2P5A7B6_PARAD|nr:hypothetical protein PanWU01x14_361360 [Parasponia andersonii]